MSSKHTNQAVFVIGAGRSGTSTITRALQALGVELGDHFKKASRKNPKGFFEDADLLAISKKVRRVLGLRADSVRWVELEEFQNPKLVALQEQAIDVIGQRFSQSPLWGFKYGRTLRILPFWDEILAQTKTDPSFLIALRNPLAVARSRSKIDSRRGRQAASDLEWLMSIVPFLRHTRPNRLVVVDYDDLMGAPVQELTRVASQLGIENSVDHGEKVRSFVDDFLDQKLRHNRFTDEDLENSPDLSPIVQAAYRCLKQLASPTRDDRLDREFWSEWELIEKETQALKPILNLIDQKELDWRRAITNPLGPLQAWALIKPWFKQ